MPRSDPRHRQGLGQVPLDAFVQGPYALRIQDLLPEKDTLG